MLIYVHNSFHCESIGYGVTVMLYPKILLFTANLIFYTAIIVGLSSLMYQATEGPNAVASVCATIEVAIQPLRRDTSVYLFTPVTGAAVIGNCISIITLLS